MNQFFFTAGGRIKCRQCSAQSSRTGNQCQRPALSASTGQKCQYHGGRGSGPKTPEGKARIAAAHTLHGQETAKARAARSAASAKLSALEDAMHLLGMTNAPRTRGRKADGYRPVRNISDLHNLILDIG